MKLGWLKDFPDPRDYDLDTEEVKSFRLSPRELPERHLIEPMRALPIFNQQDIGSCTGCAAARMYEYFLAMAGYDYEELSRLFPYKQARFLHGLKGDSGAYLRGIMQAIAIFGIPPARFNPYVTSNFDQEPDARLYSIAQNYQALQYYRLDPKSKSPEEIIKSMKINIAANRACIFGFTVFSNMGQSGDVHMPSSRSSVDGGHAVCNNGYDDNYKIGSETGAFRHDGSWGKEVGHDGHFWIPYSYVYEKYATDVWTMNKGEWLDLGVFK